MRLIARTIWRAFPELDRFDDERCRLFIDAARRSRVSMLLRATLVTLLVAAMTTGTLALGHTIAPGWFTNSPGVDNPWNHTFPPGWASIACGACVLLTIFSAFVARDQLLRWRIRRLLRVQGRCRACNYLLLGLPVSAEFKARCPECGLEAKVDASYTTLADPSGAERRVMLDAPIPGFRPLWLTPQRVRRITRVGLVVALTGLFVWGCGWVAREWWLRSQAAYALSRRVGLRDILKLAESVNPPDDGSPDAWDLMAEADGLRAKAESEVQFAPDAIQSRGGGPEYPEYTSIRPERRPAGEREAEDARTRELVALRCMARMRELGAFDTMDRLAAARRACRRFPQGIIDVSQAIGVGEYSTARRICQVNEARLTLAGEAGDRAEFMRALGANLTVIRATYRDPLVISRLVGAACEALTLRAVRRAVIDGVPPDWVPELQAKLASLETDDPGPCLAIEGERAFCLEETAAEFSDVAIVKAGGPAATPAPMPGVPWPPPPTGKYGTYRGNVAALNEYFDALRDELRRPPWVRPESMGIAKSDYARVNTIARSLGYSCRVMDFGLLQREGLRVMLALERYRADHADYPDSLARLVPNYLPAMPRDPLIACPLGYQRQNPLLDDRCRSYILYSFGADRTDNADNALSSRQWLDEYNAEGLDFELNR